MSNVVSFLSGMACGSIITFVVMRTTSKKAENAIQRDHEDAMTEEELREHYIKGLQELGMDVHSMSDEEYEKYDKYVESYVNPVDDDEDEDEDEGPVEVNPEPYEILPDIFGKKDQYDTVTLSWYKGDSVMADEDNDILENWQAQVGDINEILNSTKKDIDAIYIRNEVRMADYEILIYDDKYAHAVMGEEDDEEQLGNMAD